MKFCFFFPHAIVVNRINPQCTRKRFYATLINLPYYENLLSSRLIVVRKTVSLHCLFTAAQHIFTEIIQSNAKLWGNDDPLFPSTCVALGNTRRFEAWSQNLGHDGVLTTFYSYGNVPDRRQSEIIQGLASSQHSTQMIPAEIAKEIAREMHYLKAKE